jgi:hypothetical protein
VLEDDHATDELAGDQIPVALIDLLELVLAGDELIELEMSGLVQAQQPRRRPR